MADLTENLITYVNTLTTFHVGEVVPEHVTTGYVWIRQTGQMEHPDLAAVATVATTFYDMEVVGTDIDSVRDETAAIKAAFRAIGKFPSGFESVVEAFAITDHDDDYIYRSIDGDSRWQVAALSLSVHHVLS